MPKLKERAAFTLSAPLKAALEKSIPKSKRSQFVEKAIARALLSEAKQNAIDAIDNAPLYETNGEDSVEMLRNHRDERARIVASKHRSKNS